MGPGPPPGTGPLGPIVYFDTSHIYSIYLYYILNIIYMVVSILFRWLRRGKKLTTEQWSKIQKIKKQPFWLFSDSYERSRRAVRGKWIVQTSRVFFVKIKKCQTLTKSTFYGPMGPIWAHGLAHGPNLDPWAWPMGPGPMGPGPKWAHVHYLSLFVGSIFKYFGLN